MKFFTIFISVLTGVVCKTTEYRLTERENEIRIGSCGVTLGETLWLASLYGKETYNLEMEEEKVKEKENITNSSSIETTTTLQSPTASSLDVSESISFKTTDSIIVTTTEKPIRQTVAANAVFISQTHLLTSSSWFLAYNTTQRIWEWKKGGAPVDSSICLKNEKASYRTKNMTDFYVLDSRKKWRRAVEVIFLRYCEFKNKSDGFLALVVVERNDMPVPVLCLPKTISKVPQPRMKQFEYKNVSWEVNSVRKCATNDTLHFYTVGKHCSDRRGGPLVKTDSFEIDRLIGVAAIMNSLEKTSFRFHIVQEYMVEMCNIMGICGRKVVKIGLLPDPERDEKAKKTIDYDYVDLEEEPDIGEYNGHEQKMPFSELFGIFIFMWFWQ